MLKIALFIIIIFISKISFAFEIKPIGPLGAWDISVNKDEYKINNDGNSCID